MMLALFLLISGSAILMVLYSSDGGSDFVSGQIDSGQQVCIPGSRLMCGSCTHCSAGGTCQQECNAVGSGYNCISSTTCDQATSTGNTFVAGEVTNCDDIYMSFIYSGEQYFGSGSLANVDWEGQIGPGTSNGGSYSCSLSDGSDPGPWRLAVFEGDDMLSYAELNTVFGNLNEAVATEPKAGSSYTVECVEVVPDTKDNSNWDATGFRCPGVTINSTLHIPIILPPPDPEPTPDPTSTGGGDVLGDGDSLPETAVISDQADAFIFAGFLLLLAYQTNRWRKQRRAN